MTIRALGVATVALFTFTGAAAAQAWDAPSFMPPRPGDNVGVYLSDMSDFAIEGIWRQSGNLNLGLRVGYIDTPTDGRLKVGAETWNLLVEAGQQLPVDVAWTLGAGAAFGDGTVLEIPAGVTFGWTGNLDPLVLQAYAHPRLGVFIASYGNDTDADLDVLFDLGLDATVTEDLTLRIGATLGGQDAIGVGLAYRWSRGAVVR